MRGLLLLLVLFSPIVLANPIFWWLAQTVISAAPATYIEADGQARQALIGPRSYWPDWALRPDGARLTVEASFSAAPPSVATGYGTLQFSGDVATGIAAFVDKLQTAGWKVETRQKESVAPSLPPTPFVLCEIRATESSGEGRLIVAAIPLTTSIPARQHWYSALPPEYTQWPPLHGPPC